MGPLTRAERLLLAVFSLVLLLWLASEWIALSATAVAWLGVAMLLLTRVLEWKDILEEKGAWDALIWFGGLVMLSTELHKAGFPQAFARAAAGFVQGWPWWWALVALVILYTYSHYAFASLVAHVTAMFPAFFAAMVGFGAPPLVTGMAFGVFSSLNAAITHYGTGPAPIVFGAGYVTQAQWWRIGFIISLLHLAIWLPIGFLWWKSDWTVVTEELMKTYRVAVIPGDGIGREVTPAAIRTLETAAERFGFRFEWEQFPWGSEHYFAHGRMMPEDALDRLRKFDAIFFGAVGDPRLQDNVTLNGLLLPIRRGFDQYACVRPAVLYPGVPSPLAGRKSGDIDFTVVRENTEGEYAQVGGASLHGRAAGSRDAGRHVHAAWDRARDPVRVRSHAPPRAASGC